MHTILLVTLILLIIYIAGRLKIPMMITLVWIEVNLTGKTILPEIITVLILAPCLVFEIIRRRFWKLCLSISEIESSIKIKESI